LKEPITPIKSKQSRSEWEKAYTKQGQSHKNKYPSSEVISFIMSNFSNTIDKSHIKILDVGCGWGNNLKFLNEQGFETHGVDFSMTAVTHCQKYHKNIIHGNLTKLPYKNDTFDSIIDRMSIQHNTKERINIIINEMHRILKPGGKFFSIILSDKFINYLGFTVSHFSDQEIINLLKKFSKYTLDYQEISLQNQKLILRSHIIVAQK